MEKKIEIDNSLLQSIMTLRNYCKTQSNGGCAKCPLTLTGCKNELPRNWKLKVNAIIELKDEEVK